MAEACVSLIPGVSKLIADMGYDTNAFRRYLKEQRITSVIPGKSNRKTPLRFDKLACHARNVVETLLLSPQRLPPHRHPLR
jgi:transposase